MKEPELTPADLISAPAAAAASSSNSEVAAHSVEKNPVFDGSQHDSFPGEGEEGEELLDFDVADKQQVPCPPLEPSNADQQQEDSKAGPSHEQQQGTPQEEDSKASP
eukprot:4243949-Karenia_brevis.AAC.1